MKPEHRQALVSTIALGVVFAVSWAVYAQVARFIVAIQPVPPEVRYKTTLPAPSAHKFTRSETLDFLEAAQTAETITDPLQRCLVYPDPPGSHWDHTVVAAYCKYRNQKVMTFAQARQLIEAGKAAELDKLLAQALHAQMTDPDAAGLLDRIYSTSFGNGSFDIRPVLDAWKRQSPDSAFAYAASGLAYEEMAFKVRGEKWLSDTPAHQLVSMDRLAAEANADLQQALRLDPRVTPIYSTMIELGGMTLGHAYGLAAVRRGLAVAPDNLAIYGQWMWLEEPKWGGSLEAMADVAREAHRHAAANPLLKLKSQAVDLYRINNCRCSSDQQLAAYVGIADHLIGYRDLQAAGDAARDANNSEAAAIYLSEALRFNPALDSDRINRMYALVHFRYLDWAVAEGSRMIAREPDNEYAVKARGWAYLNLGDAPHAERDLETAARLDPGDGWAQWRLGDAYVIGGHWGKAWAIANKLIDEHPEYAAGWLVRARVQIHQPRPGIDKTLTYLDAHFASDSELALYIAQLRSEAQQRVVAVPVAPAKPARSTRHLPKR